MHKHRRCAVQAIIIIVLILVLGVACAGQALAGPPAQGAVHIVQPGETLSLIAQRYGVSMEDLVRWNGITNPDRIEVGQRLLVYLPASPLAGPLSSPFVRVHLSPWPAVQGETVTCEVITERPARLTAVYKGGEVPFVQEGLRSWALLPVHAMQEPGIYLVELRAYPASEQGDSQPIGRLSANLYVVAGTFETYDIVIPPSSEKAGLLNAELIRAEWRRLAGIFSQRTPEKLWSGTFRYPLEASVRRVTSAFGERRSYNGGPASSYHEGLDFGAPEGTPVYAPAAGRIALAEPLTVRGRAVVIDHGLGVYSGFWHLSEILVSAGQSVKPGDLIGRVGNTGLSTGSHLHWEVRVNVTAVNPVQWTQSEMPAVSAGSPEARTFSTLTEAYPLAVGKQWVYRVETVQRVEGWWWRASALVTETVTSVTEQKGAQFVALQREGAQGMALPLLDSPSELVLMDGRLMSVPAGYAGEALLASDELQAQSLRFIWPMQVGDRWGQAGPDRMTWEVRSSGVAETPAGRFSGCYQLAGSGTGEVQWVTFCAGVGEVLRERYLLHNAYRERWELTAWAPAAGQ